MTMRLLSIVLALAIGSPAAAQNNPPSSSLSPMPCQPYPECVLTSSTLVPAAPTTGIQTQRPAPIGITTDKGLVIQGISPLDRSTFRVPSLGKTGEQ